MLPSQKVSAFKCQSNHARNPDHICNNDQGLVQLGYKGYHACQDSTTFRLTDGKRMDPMAMDVDLNTNDVLDNYASQSKL